MLTVLRHREFRLLILARFASRLGNQATTVALGFAVLALTGRAGDVGLVLAVEGFAIGGFLLLGGMLGDRFSRRRLMISADLVRLVSQGIMAVLLISGVARRWRFSARSSPRISSTGRRPGPSRWGLWVCALVGGLAVSLLHPSRPLVWSSPGRRCSCHYCSPSQAGPR